MKYKKYKNLLTNIEFVGKGHPDIFADTIAEAIFHHFFKQDNDIKTGIEVMVTRDKIFLGGEIGKDLTTRDNNDVKELIYNLIDKVYSEKWWPNFKKVEIINNIKAQSPELSEMVEKENKVTGDQGITFGFYYKPRQELIDNVYRVLYNIVDKFDLSLDFKAILKDSALFISFCGLKSSYKEIIEDSILTKLRFTTHIRSVTINKLDWNIGGPLADTGMVGRKLMIESFGTGIPHGGGAYSGKDYSKVDKTGLLIAKELAFEKASKLNFKHPVLVEIVYFINNEWLDVNIRVGDKLVKKTDYNFKHGMIKYAKSLKNNIKESK